MPYERCPIQTIGALASARPGPRSLESEPTPASTRATAPVTGHRAIQPGKSVLGDINTMEVPISASPTHPSAARPAGDSLAATIGATIATAAPLSSSQARVGSR